MSFKFILMSLQRLVEDIEYTELLHKAAGGQQYTGTQNNQHTHFVSRMFRYFRNIILSSGILSQSVGDNSYKVGKRKSYGVFMLWCCAS